MPPTYRIRNWKKHFETHETRKLTRLNWVPFPTKHDGRGYRRLILRPDGAAVFGAWVLMVEIAAKVPREGRGVLADDQGPFTPEDMALMTGCPAHIFAAAISALLDVGWIEATRDESPAISRDAGKIPRTNGRTDGRSERPDGRTDGREGNGNAPSASATAPAPGARWEGIPPLTEIAAELGVPDPLKESRPLHLVPLTHDEQTRKKAELKDALNAKEGA